MRSKPLLFAVLSILLVAGCVTPSKDTPGGPDPTAGPGEVGGQPSLFGPTRMGDQEGFLLLSRSELFVAVDPTGEEVLSCTHGLFMGPSRMWASTDGGESFSTLTPDPRTGPGGDCDVVIDADGRWHFLHHTLQSATLTSTADRGATWDVHPLTILPTTIIADRPWLHALGDALLMTYHDIHFAPGAAAVTRSTDGGATWSLPQYLALADTEHRQLLVGKPSHVLGTDEVVVPVLYFTADNFSPGVGGPADARPVLFHSQDGGLNWEAKPVPGLTRLAGQTPVGAGVAGDGTLYFAATTADQKHVALVASRDGGQSWSDPAMLGNSTGAGEVWFDGHATGGTAVWTALSPDDGERYLFVARLNASRDPVIQEVLQLGPADHSEYLAVDHDDSGRAFIVYSKDNAAFLMRLP